MIIREADGKDADTIWAMLEPVFRAGNTYAIDRDISREAALAYWMGEHVFLAEQDGLPLGTFYIQRNRPGGGAHYCNCGFVTAPGAEGRGVARAMLEHALAKARAFGFEAMVFNFVVASNVARCCPVAALRVRRGRPCARRVQEQRRRRRRRLGDVPPSVTPPPSASLTAPQQCRRRGRRRSCAILARSADPPCG